MLFSKAEKNNELKMKQRSELMKKQSNALLEHEAEKRLGREVLMKLEAELAMLEDDDGHRLDSDSDRMSEYSSPHRHQQEDIIHKIVTISPQFTSSFNSKVVAVKEEMKIQSNVFAAELLYLMRTAADLLG